MVQYWSGVVFECCRGGTQMLALLERGCDQGCRPHDHMITNRLSEGEFFQDISISANACQPALRRYITIFIAPGLL